MADKGEHVHKPDDQGWFEYSREDIDDYAEMNPKEMKGVVKYMVLLCECGERIGQKTEYER